jgi:ring-1,2-phenylacetyl-CoA epoxidase subunit PaaB
MRTYEVFLRRAGKEGFAHAGSLDAPDDELALVLAREAYVRRGEGDEMWLVDRAHVLVGGADLLTSGADRPHRHNDGSVVAARRRARRERTPGGES